MKAEYVDHMGDDLSVVNAARVSFAKQSEFEKILKYPLKKETEKVYFSNEIDTSKEPEYVEVLKEKDQKLINYLAKHDHWTPFAHTAVTLRMQAPIPIRTQCFKHKIGLVENEESRRYISTEPSFYTPVFREAADNKKQGSGDIFTQDKYGKSVDYWNAKYQHWMRQAINNYYTLLDHGVCEEQARLVLPQAAEVNWIWTGNLVSFANFVKKRTDPNAQKEIQDLAHMVSDVIKPLFPHSWNALMG